MLNLNSRLLACESGFPLFHESAWSLPGIPALEYHCTQFGLFHQAFPDRQAHAFNDRLLYGPPSGKRPNLASRSPNRAVSDAMRISVA
jgi:hypothetical protein